MPAGKYYCDYCDKEFQDTQAARKRHLLGTQHQRNKALWFDSINRGLNDNLQPREVDDVGGNRSHGSKTNPTFGMSLGNLPPSLQPPPEGGYPPLPYVDWG